MRSSPRSFIMWTYSCPGAASRALLGRSSSVFVGGRGSRVLPCVQSLRRHSSVINTSTCTFVVNSNARSTLVRGTTTDSLKMLNIPYLSSSCISRKWGTNELHTHSCLLSIYKESTPPGSSMMDSRLCSERDMISITSSQTPAIYQDEEEDEDEEKKREIWNVGPVPAATFTFAAYANDSEIIKKLVDLGVDLSKLEKKKEVLPLILKLNWDQQVAPCIEFLSDIGISRDRIGWYVTKNPFIFHEDTRNMSKRLDYLRMKEFSPESILRIVSVNPFWLSFSISRIDRRLGFFQSFFNLNGNQVRMLATSGPKLITSSLGRVKDVTFKVKEEMGFTSQEIVSLLLESPRIWKEDPDSLWKRFDYLHNETKFSHEDIVRSPEVMLVRESRLKNRIGFLKHVGKAQFNPEKPNYVSFKMVYSGEDAEFATKIAKCSVLEFNNYMKSL